MSITDNPCWWRWLHGCQAILFLTIPEQTHKKKFFSEIHKTDFSFFHSISLIFTSLPIHRFIHYLDNKKNEHFRYWIILAWCSVNVKFEITFFCFLLPNFYRKVLFFSILFRFWNKFGTKMWAKTFFAFNVKWI